MLPSHASHPLLSLLCLQVCSLCLHLRCCPLAVASLVAEHGVSCLTACGIVPDQESNHVPCADRWILTHWTTREVQGNFSSGEALTYVPRTWPWSQKPVKLRDLQKVPVTLRLLMWGSRPAPVY